MTRVGPLARLALLVALVAPAAVAQTDPELFTQLEIPVKASGWITDSAGVLDAGTRTELESLAARYQKGSGHDVAVLLIPTLHDRPIEKVGLEVFRTWKLGREGVNDGALLLIATADHQLRIEVGRGLEGDLTDLICGRIIRNVIVPHFKSGDLPGGVRAGVIAIHAAAGGNYADIPDDAPADSTLAPIIALMVILFIVFTLVRIARRGGRSGRPRIFPFPMGFPGGFGGGGIRVGGFGGGGFGGGFGGGGFGGFGGGGGAIGGGASGHW